MTAPERRAWVEQLMGMPISIHLRGDLTNTEPAVEQAYQAFREVDRVFSTYRQDSEISRIRRGELSLDSASGQVQTVATLCEQAEARTDGAFTAWLPAPGNPTGPRLFEPTGLVKGWAAQQITVDLATHLPNTDVLINAGGDVAVHCNRTDTPDWRLAVESPLKPGEVVAEVSLRHGGLATSGTAARGLHILDPTTGRPVHELASVSVAAPSLMWADVYATAAFVKGPASATWLAGVPKCSWFVVGADGQVASGVGTDG